MSGGHREVCVCVQILLLMLTASGCDPRSSGSSLSQMGALGSAVEEREDGFLVFSWARASSPVCGADVREDFTPCVVSIAGVCGVQALSDVRVADCGGSENGPFARAAAFLVEKGPARVWRLEGAAVDSGASDAGFTDAQVRVVDTFTLRQGTSDLLPGEPVPLFVRVEVDGEITGSSAKGFSFYVVDAVFWRIDPDGKRESSPFFGRTLAFRRGNGEHDRVVFEESLPGVILGDKILMTSTFVHVAADPATPFTPARSTLTADYSLCPGVPGGPSGVAIEGESGAIGDCGAEEGDLGIAAADVVQSVFGANLVSGKDTAIRVDVTTTHTGTVPARLRFLVDQVGHASREFTEVIDVPPCPGGTKTFYFPTPLDPGACGSSDAGRSLRDIGMEPLPGGGIYRVTATIAPEPTSVGDVDPSNDARTTFPYSVRDTHLKLSYVALECPACPTFHTVPDEELAEAVVWSDRHNLAMLPLGHAGYQPQICRDLAGRTCTYIGDAPCGGANCGLARDLQEVYRLAKLADPSASRAVGFVPPEYFRAHGSPNAINPGVSSRKTILASAEFPSGSRFGVHDPTVTHELVHTFILPNDQHRDLPASGYWVGCRTYGFPSCEIPPSGAAVGLMVETSPAQFEPPQIWIEPPLYSSMVSPLVNEPDPAILLITGSWGRSGAVELNSFDELPAGNPSDQGQGDFVIEVVAADGTVLHHHVIDVFFEWKKWRGVPAESVDWYPITEAVPYPQQAARIRFRDLRPEINRVVLDVDPLSVTLRGAISMIPPVGYAKNPEQRRKALLNKVDALQQAIDQGDLRGALQKLRNDLRKHVQDWVVPYEKDPSRRIYYDRAEVLAQIDRVEARLVFRTSQAP